MNVNVKELRERLKLTQPQLAQMLGVSAITVWNWESGKSRPSGAQSALLQQLSNRVEGNDADSDKIGQTILQIAITGGLIAFFSWLFTKDNK